MSIRRVLPFYAILTAAPVVPVALMLRAFAQVGLYPMQSPILLGAICGTVLAGGYMRPAWAGAARMRNAAALLTTMAGGIGGMQAWVIFMLFNPLPHDSTVGEAALGTVLVEVLSGLGLIPLLLAFIVAPLSILWCLGAAALAAWAARWSIPRPLRDALRD